MTHVLPPTCDADRLQAELQFLPKVDRDDAVQESWLAYLAGLDPVRALKGFARRERRWRQRNVLSGQVDPTAVAYA